MANRFFTFAECVGLPQETLDKTVSSVTLIALRQKKCMNPTGQFHNCLSIGLRYDVTPTSPGTLVTFYMRRSFRPAIPTVPNRPVYPWEKGGDIRMKHFRGKSTSSEWADTWEFVVKGERTVGEILRCAINERLATFNMLNWWCSCSVWGKTVIEVFQEKEIIADRSNDATRPLNDGQKLEDILNKVYIKHRWGVEVLPFKEFPPMPKPNFPMPGSFPISIQSPPPEWAMLDKGEIQRRRFPFRTGFQKPARFKGDPEEPEQDNEQPTGISITDSIQINAQGDKQLSYTGVTEVAAQGSAQQPARTLIESIQLALRGIKQRPTMGFADNTQ